MRDEVESVASLIREALSEFEGISSARDPPWTTRARMADLVTEASSKLKVVGGWIPRAHRAAEHVERAREQLAEAFDGHREAARIVVRARLSEALSIVEELLADDSIG